MSDMAADLENLVFFTKQMGIIAPNSGIPAIRMEKDLANV